jgi:membrane-associated phospholipid phosphatase
MIHTGLVVQVLKHLFGRQRPHYEDGKDAWHGPSGIVKRYTEGPLSRYNAFPSGHTIVVWGTAAVISEKYKDHTLVPIVCYSLATLVGLSRITESRHWLSDVFMGAVLGYTIGKYVTRERSEDPNVGPMARNVIRLNLSMPL